MNNFLFGVMFSVISYFAVFKVFPYFKEVISVYKNNKLFYKRVKDRDSSEKKWTEVMGPDGKKLLIDENSGWCPAKNAFLPKKAIEALKNVEKMEDEYVHFKSSRMKSISAFYNIPLETIEQIHTDVLMIKKDFYLGNVKSFLDEIKNRKAET